MRKLLLLLPLLIAVPAAADMGYDFYEERANTLLDNVAAGTEAFKANDINLMCLEYGSAARIMAAYMPGLRKHFPGSPWMKYRQILRNDFAKFGCEARGFGSL